MEAQERIAPGRELADDPEPRPVAVPLEPDLRAPSSDDPGSFGVRTRFCDELPFGFGWIADEPPRLERASHALVDDGRVWLVDPVDDPALDERIDASGRVVGVIQLLDRHGRDAAALAARYDVPLHVAPRDGVPGSPFRVLRAVDFPTWREAALWWPERRTPGRRGCARHRVVLSRRPARLLAVHPLLRLFPPRSLGKLAPEHVLCGHGEGVHGAEAAPALREALSSARRGIPRWLVGSRAKSASARGRASAPSTKPKSACRQVACANARGFVSSGGIPRVPRAGW